MNGLARRFIALLDALPQAGLVSQAEQGTPGADAKNPPAPEKEPFSAVLTGYAFVFSSPDAQDTDPARLALGTPVTVYQTVTGKEGSAGSRWYLISSPGKPSRYVYAGWVRPQIRPLHQLLQDYFQVAERLWEAAAEDRLEIWTASEEYSEAIARLERDVAFLEDACKRAPQPPKAKGSRLWSRRARLYKRALKDWQSCLGNKPYEFLADQAFCGGALLRIHGRLALAGLSRFELLLMRGLEIAIVAAAAAWIGIACLLLYTASIDSADLTSQDLSTLYTAAPIFIAVALALLLLAFVRPSLSIVNGWVLGRTAGSLRMFLSRWFRYVGMVEIPLLILAAPLLILFEDLGIGLSETVGALGNLCFSFESSSPCPAPKPVLGGLAALLPPLFFLLVAIGVLVVPFTVTAQVCLFRALKDPSQKSPEARRWALTPAWKVFLVNSSFSLTFIGSLLHSSVSLNFLGNPIAPFLPGLITWHQVIYLGLSLALYGLLIEWPYHQGIARWRAARLGELALSRNEIAEQLSQETTAPPEQPSRYTVQDHYALWQYYRTQEQEVADEPSWSLTLKKGSFVSLVLLILSFVFEHLDTINKALHLLGGQ